MSHDPDRLRELKSIAVKHAIDALHDYDYVSVAEDQALHNEPEWETVHYMITRLISVVFVEECPYE